MNSMKSRGLSQGARQAPDRSASKARSELWFAKLAIRVLGYDRVLKLHRKGSNSLQWLRLLQRDSWTALRERKLHIAALKPEGAASSAPEKTVAPAAPALLFDRTELKVAVLIPGFLIGKGGAEKVAGRVADLLGRSGMKVDLVCRPQRSTAPPYPLSEQIRIRPLIERDERQVAQLRGEGYDLLVGFGMPHFYSRIAHISRVLDVPFVVQECTNPRNLAAHVGGAHLCRNDEEAYWLRQAVLAHAAAVRFTVPAYAESVVGDVRPFTYAFYNALVSSRPPRVESALAKKIVCVSGLKDGNKNGMVAVNAFCRFASRAPGWSLHLYGPNNFRRELDAATERFPNATVIDHGTIDNVDEIYGDAHALVIPSFEEGLPNVVVEALSYGVPCIGFSDCNGVKQIITHEETGLLVDRNNPEGLDAAIARMADPDFRRGFSIEAMAFAEAHFRPELWEANWLRLIRNSANQLNNEAQPQMPVARDSQDRRAARWSGLLDTYLHFGD